MDKDLLNSISDELSHATYSNHIFPGELNKYESMCLYSNWEQPKYAWVHVNIKQNIVANCTTQQLHVWIISMDKLQNNLTEWNDIDKDNI